MADNINNIQIGINVTKVEEGTKVVERSFDTIKKEAIGVVEATDKVERGLSALGKAQIKSINEGNKLTKSLVELKRAEDSLYRGLDLLNVGTIKAATFQERYGKAVSLLKNEIKNSYGENLRYSGVLNIVNGELEKQKRTLNDVKDYFNRNTKALKEQENALRQYNKELNKQTKQTVQNYFKDNSDVLKKQTKALDDEQKAIAKSQKELERYNRSKQISIDKASVFSIALGTLAAKGLARVANYLIDAPHYLKEYSDEWIKVTNIIKLGVRGEDNLVAARQKVIDIANETRTPIEAQVVLFNRLTLSQKELGASTEQIQSVIKGVGQALGVTATSTLESRGALLQLAQAFGQPIVRAEELNSILEGTPRIAKALADGFGVTRAGLRNLVLEGKITNKALFESFMTQLPLLEQEFRNVAPTIDQSLTLIRNSLITFIGEFNDFSGVSSLVSVGFYNIAFAINKAAEAFALLNKVSGNLSIKEDFEKTRKEIEKSRDPEGFKKKVEEEKKTWQERNRAFALQQQEEAKQKRNQESKKSNQSIKRFFGIETAEDQLKRNEDLTERYMESNRNLRLMDEKSISNEILRKEQEETTNRMKIYEKLSHFKNGLNEKEFQEFSDFKRKEIDVLITQGASKEQATKLVEEKIKSIREKMIPKEDTDYKRQLERRVKDYEKAQDEIDKIELKGSQASALEVEYMEKLKGMSSERAKIEDEYFKAFGEHARAKRSEIELEIVAQEKRLAIQKKETEELEAQIRIQSMVAAPPTVRDSWQTPFDLRKKQKEENIDLLMNWSDEYISVVKKPYVVEQRELDKLIAKYKEVQSISGSPEFQEYIKKRQENINIQKSPLSAFIKETKDSLEPIRAMENATVKAFQAMEDSLVDFIMTGKMGWRDLASTAIAEITRIFIRSQIIKPLTNFVQNSDIIGSIGKFFMSANGNVVSGSNISSYSNSIVSKPTIIPNIRLHKYASGGALMGEAGPEAIMPLTRTSSGKLGVNAAVNKSQPIINIKVDNRVSDKANASVTTGKDDLGNTVIGIIIDAATRNVNGLGSVIQGVANRR